MHDEKHKQKLRNNNKFKKDEYRPDIFLKNINKIKSTKVIKMANIQYIPELKA